MDIKNCRFIAYYREGIPFVGGGLIDTKWKEAPANIKNLAYVLPSGDRLVLQDYEQYNHLVGCAQPIGGKPVIESIFLMGERGGQVAAYQIMLQNGIILAYRAPLGKEWRGQSGTSGWKKGA